jgi:sortase family protein
MASRRSRPRRFLLPIVLAAVLAAEVTGLALAQGWSPRADAGVTPAAVVGATPGPAAPVPDAAAVANPPVSLAGRADPEGAGRDTSIGPKPSALRAGAIGLSGFDLPASVRQTAVAGRTIRATSAPTRRAATSASTATSRKGGSGYHGVNHVWIPSLGVNKVVQSFPCSRSRPPDAGVYRWGCAGRNNVYLLGHAWSTFKPLHDAYVGGRLRAGMRVIYADGSGRVHTYSVSWWRVVAPTTAAKWAWAPLSVPGMTLQTCVGANSAYRLMVRLVRIA